MLVASDALLGRRVQDHRGRDIGVVVEVAPRRASGFVLVGLAGRPRGRQPVVRVDLDEVGSFRDGVLRLRPVPGPN